VTFDEFVAARLQPLLRYAVMLTGDPHLAEDLVQETMVRVHMQWRRVSATTLPEVYVKRMLTNAYLDHRRGSWFRRVVLRREPDERAGGADHAELAAVRAEVWSLLAVLPARQRAALVLRFYEEFDDSRIAAVLDCAEGTVRSYISRGLATLRRHLAASSTTIGAGGAQ
jgi:RNA polymerase sigma-70 factor (sigma-E family)